MPNPQSFKPLSSLSALPLQVVSASLEGIVCAGGASLQHLLSFIAKWGLDVHFATLPLISIRSFPISVLSVNYPRRARVLKVVDQALLPILHGNVEQWEADKVQ